MNVIVLRDAAALSQAVADRLVERLAQLQANGRSPSVVLTGGTIANAIYAALPETGVDWTSVDFFWGDERFVPEGHVDRNDQQARNAFLDRLGVPDARIHSMPAHDCALGAREAADNYARVIPDVPFDLVLLGMGADGHIASLFPGFAQLHETERKVVEVFDSPKPPAVRISLTMPTLNHADSVWFLVSGEGKAEAVARALGPGTLVDTPATGVRGGHETLWLLDEAAAADL
ncbi:MAG: 6-phosphogluconolactonase [Aeromicrobium sp.]